MNLLQRIRVLFGYDLAQDQVNIEILNIAKKLARKGHVEIMKGGYLTLEKAMSDLNNHVFIVSINGRYIPKPPQLKQWFKEYVSSSRLDDYGEKDQ